MTYSFAFYWLSWIFWGIATFFMKKRPLRSIFTCLILGSILCSNIYFSLGGYQILFSFIWLILVFGLLYTNLSVPLYHLFVSFILMIGYTTILIWNQSSSILLFLPEPILGPLICSILIFLMINGLYHRLIAGTLGIASGEVLHGLILSSYHVPVMIGDVDFFVKLYMFILCLILVHIIQKGKTQCFTFINTYIKN